MVSESANPTTGAPVAVDPATGVDQEELDTALKQGRKDAKVREENPDKAVVRRANRHVGGESFDYLDAVSG